MAFEGLSEKLSAAFKKLKNRGKLSEADVKEAMREVRLALLEADVNYKVAKDFVKTVTEKAVGEQVLQSLTPAQQVIKIVNDEMTALMGATHTRINLSSRIPTIILMCGLQGSGKTTHSAKLAYHFKQQGKRPLLVACDIYRPAAIDQLKVVGQKAGVPVFEMGQADPLLICKKALQHAGDYGNDIVIIDTAGRLHIDEALMQELQGIKEQVKPHETLLVIDSMTGQDAVTVAQSFDTALGVDGVILTKLDGDTRGGAALSVRAATGKPIKFAGVGEKIGDLEPFYPDRMASRILGFGDVMTLIEKAGAQVDAEAAAAAAKKLKEGQLDFNDLLDQMAQMKKMGSLSSILDMIPGMGGKVSEEDAQEGEKQLRRTESIILSMTPAEREKPSLMNPSRKRRIAAGSGTRVEDVNRLIRQLEQMQKLMKQLGGKGKKRRGRLPFGGGMPGGMPGFPM
ncbi:MAG: signal recognition particle protein [Angelakisella sp.]|nr:signal recognition particle protein [Angelakisella sp.]